MHAICYLISSKILGALLTLFLLSPFTCTAADRLNVVVILVGDLHLDTFGFMGHPFLETPGIDHYKAAEIQLPRTIEVNRDPNKAIQVHSISRYMGHE